MSAPTVWVDADACPRPVRDVVCRAAERRQVRTVFVAASPVNVPRGRFISSRTVAAGFDAADDAIAEEVAAGSASGLFDAKAYRDASGIARNLTIQELEYYDGTVLIWRIGDECRVIKSSDEIFGRAG